jgi:hypothetical protein
MEAILDIAGWVCVFAALAFGLWAPVIVAQAYYYQGRLADQLERDLGFRHGCAYPRCREWRFGVLDIMSLTPGGAFVRAGFREGDLLPDLTGTDFFKLLHRHRGREVELVVVAGGDGPPLKERPSRRIRVRVPPASKQ